MKNFSKDVAINEFTLKTYERMAKQSFPALENFNLTKNSRYSTSNYILVYSTKINGDDIFQRTIRGTVEDAIIEAKETMMANIQHYNYMADDNIYHRSFIMNQALDKKYYSDRFTGSKYDQEFANLIKKKIRNSKYVINMFRRVMALAV